MTSGRELDRGGTGAGRQVPVVAQLQPFAAQLPEGARDSTPERPWRRGRQCGGRRALPRDHADRVPARLHRPYRLAHVRAPARRMAGREKWGRRRVNRIDFSVHPGAADRQPRTHGCPRRVATLSPMRARAIPRRRLFARGGRRRPGAIAGLGVTVREAGSLSLQPSPTCAAAARAAESSPPSAPVLRGLCQAHDRVGISSVEPGVTSRPSSPSVITSSTAGVRGAITHCPIAPYSKSLIGALPVRPRQDTEIRRCEIVRDLVVRHGARHGDAAL